MRLGAYDRAGGRRHRRAFLLRFAGTLAAMMAGSSFADLLPSPDRELPIRVAPIPFEVGTSNLGKDAKARLDEIVVWLKANPARKVRLEGHSDDPGTDEYNLAIGEKRANGVLAYMVAGGVEASRLTTVSYGRFRPLSGNGNLNSRVEIVIGK